MRPRAGRRRAAHATPTGWSRRWRELRDSQERTRHAERLATLGRITKSLIPVIAAHLDALQDFNALVAARREPPRRPPGGAAGLRLHRHPLAARHAGRDPQLRREPVRGLPASSRSRPTRWSGCAVAFSRYDPLASQRKLVAELQVPGPHPGRHLPPAPDHRQPGAQRLPGHARGRRGDRAHHRRRPARHSSTSRTPATPSPPRSRPTCSSRSSPPRATTAWAWACRCAGPPSRATAASSPAAAAPAQPTRFRIRLPRLG